ncbi:MAG: Holliday junction branch migration protein RuvA [Eubacterium sp.]|nr:Holliday junction branch migration protein RuvA [Eubacterium sp.]
MISYIIGVVDSVESDRVVLEHNETGYNIFMPNASLEMIGVGEKLKIYTYFSVREDAMQLYGFLTKDELDLFKKLIGVSGVGPKGGLAIISACPGDSLQMAIISGDAKAISKAQGIGVKTAQRIIIELKDKIDIQDMISVQGAEKIATVSTVQSDAIEALLALGYSRTDAFNAVKKVDISEKMDVEMLLKAALKNIM